MTTTENRPDLGTFSISLSVKDIDQSLAFYGHLGFEVIDGGHMRTDWADDGDRKWRILKNGDAVIGLFQGLFAGNVLTFNPKDVRSIQKHLKEHGVKLHQAADDAGTGPAHITLIDPDGNAVLIDQH